MATTFVEAQSLSDITQLASNPPRYPRNPTEQRRQPLTLYLARVPGSRDIILTPLRPQLKNVTAEDVASSLYYVHFNTPEDLRFLEEDGKIIPEETEAEVGLTNRTSVSRKPLPKAARSSPDQIPLAQRSSQSPQERETTSGSPNAEIHVEPRQRIPRRPLGPRPQQINTAIERKPVPSAGSSPSTHSPSKFSSVPPLNPGTSSEAPNTLTSPISNSIAAQNNIPDTFSITLIRRDPGSSAQWNIGSVSGRPTHDEATDRRGKSPTKKPYFDISVQLTNPGYTIFRHAQPTQDNTRSSLDKGRSRASSVTAASFDREIRMEGTNFWARASVQHKRTGSDSSIPRGRSFSGSSAIEPRNLDSVDEDTTESQPKGYVFTSPWGGRCKFSTGGGGRTLRCKHTLPGPIGATESLATGHAAATLSELRFNLPGSDVLASATDALKKEFRDSNFKEKFKQLRQKLTSEDGFPALTSSNHPRSTSYAATYPSDDEAPPLPPRTSHTPLFVDSSDEGERPPLPYRPHEEGDERLDLSLGQEKAGGGIRGKRAKLGKLIIHDEGFKMLDLIVGANMGIWWSVWESEDR